MKEPPEGPPLKGWKKAVLVALATAPIGLAIYSFAFMAKSEMAFDEARCPYEEAEVRLVEEGIRVREDRRTCEDGVEEHRWVLLREGEPETALGIRRLEARLYEGYSWSASVAEGRVEIEIENPGHDPRIFREPADDGGVGR